MSLQLTRVFLQEKKISEILSTGVRVLHSRFLLRNCTSVGFGVRVYGKVIISNEGKIVLGERIRIRGTHVPVELATGTQGVLEIGSGSFINSGTSLCALSHVSVGKNCMIGNYTLIMDGDFHDLQDINKPGKVEPVIIEDNVWIASRVTILKGVHIGTGAVVAAGAVVTKNVPARTLVAGVPAKVIRSLDP